MVKSPDIRLEIGLFYAIPVVISLPVSNIFVGRSIIGFNGYNGSPIKGIFYTGFSVILPIIGILFIGLFKVFYYTTGGIITFFIFLPGKVVGIILVTYFGTIFLIEFVDVPNGFITFIKLRGLYF